MITRVSFARLAAVLLLLASPLWAQATTPLEMTALSLKAPAAEPEAQSPGPATPLVAGSYVFATTTTGSLVDMSTGTSTLVAANQDDSASALTPIGFDFFFQGARQSQFSVNSNGTLRLGAAASTTGYNPLAQAAQSLITAYGADQRSHTTGKVHSKVIGAAPNRTLVVEWLNMQANFNSGGTADLTYQVQLSEATGAITFAYGAMAMSTLGAADANAQSPQIGFSSNNLAGTVGSITAAQGGAPAPTFDGASAVPVENLYVAGPITVLTSAANGTRRTFSLTPPVAAAPGGPVSFSAISATGMTLNWGDAANELGYAIYSSTDGVNFSFVNTAAQNATSLAVTGLAPSTSYTWRVLSFTEGGTAFISGVQATNAPTANTSLGSGLWSAPGTWSAGVVPSSGDAVTIAAGHTVTIDVAATAFSVSVAGSGVLQFEQTTARTLTTGGDVTVQAGGTLQSNPAGTVTTHSLVVGGNLSNNGTLDFSTNADTAAAGISFTGAANTTFGGSGATTDVRTITINKGTTTASTLLLNPSNFTVRGVTTDVAGWLVTTNGTIRIGGSFAGNNRVFSAAAYTIPATAGFWLDNPNYVVAAQVGNAVNNGLFRVTQGQFNQGTLVSHSMRGGAGAVFTIEGGTLNFAAQFSPQSAVTYNQSGGTVNVGIVGNNQSLFGTFELFSATSTFNMTGGNIIVHQASTGATPIDYQVLGNVVAAGGTLQIGSGATATAFNFRLRGRLPNLIIDNTTNAKTATATAQLTLLGNTTITTGSTLVIDGFVCLVVGPTFVNNGTLTGTAASTRFYFLGGSGPTTYSGTGTVTAPLLQFEVDNIAGVTIAPSTTNPIIATRFNNFSGGLTGSGKLTLGNGGATTAVVQLGVTGVTQTVNGFDVPPVFNAGTGGVNLLYAPELTGRTTGNEMPPSRTLNLLSITNTNDITVAGGNVTINGAAAGALALGTARLITGANVVYFDSVAGTVTRTTGYVLGNFRKSYPAAGTKTFEVGTANGYSPADINVTAGTFPSDVTVTPVQAKAPSIAPPAGAIDRHWNVVAPGATADLTFNYLDPLDIPGTVTEANLVLFRRDGLSYTNLGGALNAAANNIVGSAISTFGTFTLAQPGAFYQLSSDLAITKTDGSGVSLPGGTTTYTIVASNSGIDPATAAIVADTFPAACVAPTWTCVGAAGGTCAANGAGNINTPVNLPVGGSVTFTALCPVNPAAVGNLVNTATVTAAVGVIDPNGANNSATDTNVLGSQADLSITKTDGSATEIPGTPVTYTIVASNAGPGAVVGATVADTFTATLSGCAWTCTGAGGGTCPANGSGNISATVNLPVSATTTFVATCTISASASGTLANTATVTAPVGTTDPTMANNSATDTDTLTAQADIATTLVDSPDPVTAGTNLSYTATATNVGPSDAQDVSVSLPLPAGTTFVSATPSAGGLCNAATPVVCTWLGVSAPAAVRSTTIVVAVAPAQTANLSATVTGSTSTTDPVAGNNTATAVTVVQVQADLGITLTDAPDPVVAGTQLTYTALVSNTGPSDATGVTVTLPLPTGTSLVSGTVTGGGSCAGSPVICSVTGSIAPAGSRTVTVVVLVAPSVLDGTVLNATATVAAASPDPNAANNSASTTTAVIAQADLALTFTGSVPQALINVPVTFTAASLNQGPSDAQNVIVTITLTPDFRYAGHTATGATCTTPQVGNTGAIVCTWAGATAPGVTRTLVVTAFSNTEGQTAVSASTTSSTTDPVPNNNFGNLTVQVGYLVEEIPTLSGLGLLLMGLMFGLIGFVAVRRQA